MLDKDIWELYSICSKTIDKLCKFKFYYLDNHLYANCYDYLIARIENNEFQALRNFDKNKGMTKETYINMLVSCRIIGFSNLARFRKEIVCDIHCISELEEYTIENKNDMNIIYSFLNELSDEEKTYIEYYFYKEISYKEIGEKFNISTRLACKRINNITMKLKKKLEKNNLTLYDIL